MSTIVTQLQAQADVPGFSSLASGTQTDLLAGVTDAIQSYCARVFVQTTFDQFYSPEARRAFYLRQYPVTDISLIASGLGTILTVGNTSASVQIASVALTSTGVGDTKSITGISLNQTAAGVATSNPLLFATYPSITSLATAVAGVSGWQATMATAGSDPESDYPNWPTAYIAPELGSKNAKTTSSTGGAILRAYLRLLPDYELDSALGKVYLHSNYYQAHRFPDRTWAASGRLGALRCIYTAGYDSTTMPAGLQQAAFTLIKALRQNATAGLKQSEQVGVYRVTYRQTAASLIQSSGVASLLENYRRRRLT